MCYGDPKRKIQRTQQEEQGSSQRAFAAIPACSQPAVTSEIAAAHAAAAVNSAIPVATTQRDEIVSMNGDIAERKDIIHSLVNRLNSPQ